MSLDDQCILAAAMSTKPNFRVILVTDLAVELTVLLIPTFQPLEEKGDYPFETDCSDGSREAWGQFNISAMSSE